MRVILFFTIALSSTYSLAFEYFTLISGDCKIDRGIIVYTDNRKIEIINEAGHSQSLTRSEINFIIVHNTFDNPLKKIQLSKRSQSRLKKVFIGTTAKEAFVGWPIRFIDNLIIFYDIEGKAHVLELSKVLRLRPVKRSTKLGLSLSGHSPNLSYGDSIGSCRNRLKGSGNGIIPTRVLGDKIQISEFLNNFEKGYEKLNSYQERTYLYAKPFLYDKDVRLGFTLYQKAFANPEFEKTPVYFQWSQGQPYRFQSMTQLGYLAVDYLPTIEPLFISRSELKSHFFHASFVGNLNALPAGSEYYSQFREKNGGVFTPEQGLTRSGTAINYMALMGVDYESWSLSLGTSYQTYYIQFESYFREILASNLTPVIRLMLTTKKLQVYSIAGLTNVSSNNVEDLQISIDRTSSVVGVIDRFSMKSHFIRGGFSYQLSEHTKTGINALFLNAEFSETLNAGSNNIFKWEYKNINAFFYKRFGEYVALSIFANVFNYDYDYNLLGSPGKSNLTQLQTGGNFEFIF